MTTTPRRRPGLALRLLLRLLPSHLRAEHGREIDQYLRLQSPSRGFGDDLRRGLALVVDIVRAAPGAHLDVLRQDLVVAARQLRRAPGFAIAATLTLAAGIGGTVALFSLVDAVLLQPLPYPEADRLVQVSEDHRERGLTDFGISPADFRDLTGDTATFAGAAALQTRSGTALVGETPQRVQFAAVSARFFDVFGVRAATGRTFASEDDVPGSGVVVVSHAFWVGTLGGVPDALGRMVRLDGRDLRIVGVMPAAFAYPDPQVAMWTPLALTTSDFERRGARWLTGVARLRGGVSIEAANATVLARSERLAETFPVNRGWSGSVKRLQAAIVGGAGVPILLAWAAAGLILLIATANVTNLYLARAVAREGEMALRGALGARPGRLGRQLVTEGLVLAAAGGGGGLALAALLVSRLRAAGAQMIPRVAGVSVSGRAVAVTLVLVVVTTLLFSLLPAVSGSRIDLRRALEAGRRSTDRRKGRWQAVVVAVEAAVAVVVVVSASLLLRSLARVMDQPLGIVPQHAITFRIEPEWRTDLEEAGAMAHLAAEREDVSARFDALLERLRALPGVSQAGAVNRVPLAGDWWVTSVRIAGRPEASPDQRPSAWERVVTPGYLEAAGTRVLRGRGLRPSDRAAGERVVVVDETFARKFWPHADPIGAELLLDGPPDLEIRARIVGVVEAVHMNRLDADLMPAFYVPFAQGLSGHFLNWGMDVVVRQTGRADIGAAIRAAVAAEFPGTPVFAERRLEDLVRQSVALRRFQATTIGTFALVALALTLVGVYGVLALAVRERAREFAIRRALGASRASIHRHVLWRGVSMVGGGLVAGAAAALAATKLLSGMVYGIAVTDPMALAAGPLAVALVAVLAASGAAVRAMRSDPAMVLQE